MTIPSAGTAGGIITLPIPVGVPTLAATAICSETNNTGVSGVGRISVSGILIVKYDAGSMIATVNHVTCSGLYQQL